MEVEYNQSNIYFRDLQLCTKFLRQTLEKLLYLLHNTSNSVKREIYTRIINLIEELLITYTNRYTWKDFKNICETYIRQCEIILDDYNLMLGDISLSDIRNKCKLLNVELKIVKNYYDSDNNIIYDINISIECTPDNQIKWKRGFTMF